MFNCGKICLLFPLTNVRNAARVPGVSWRQSWIGRSWVFCHCGVMQSGGEDAEKTGIWIKPKTNFNDKDASVLFILQSITQVWLTAIVPITGGFSPRCFPHQRRWYPSYLLTLSLWSRVFLRGFLACLVERVDEVRWKTNTDVYSPTHSLFGDPFHHKTFCELTVFCDHLWWLPRHGFVWQDVYLRVGGHIVNNCTVQPSHVCTAGFYYFYSESKDFQTNNKTCCAFKMKCRPRLISSSCFVSSFLFHNISPDKKVKVI